MRRLLREHPLPGRVSLTLEREPDAQLAAGIEGDIHQTLVARDPRSGEIAGVASRAERRVFVNGLPVRMGYLGQLRVAIGVRRLRSLVDEGFATLHELHTAGGVSAYLTSHTADNTAARRLLVDRRSALGPTYAPAGKLTTYVLPARSGGAGFSRTSRVRRREGGPAEAGPYGCATDPSALADCLTRNLRRFQFAPVWDTATLACPRRMRGLSTADFETVRRGNRIAGCAALWDQRAFKQVVVRGYAASLGRWRPVFNVVAPWLGHPRLPSVGTPLAFGYVSHLAADDDDPGIVAELVSRIRDRASTAGLSHVVVGAPAGHQIAAAIERLGRHERYETELFLVCWPDGNGLARSLDGRPPQPEVAIL